ncbi:EpsD family peptidyl-prolyl cis-trans isomerase [Telluria beijingensis]|uniref:EpsD family peptidyl-prolyl cis-trans isomerase n=1 Tax=Telluria beijingensis TaxID=3068633 RepID=UPI002795AAAF|nr:EpsD family peptidyl-prolyl cis-trans isomerase [Massilia sp. REN29]
MNNPHHDARSTILSFILGREAARTGMVPALVPALVLALAGMTLAGCQRDQPAADAKPGQALASVNGEEITVLQLNEEMQRAGVPAAQQQVASKQLLQALIDRELLESEAAKEKLDRDPKVMQAIERARSLIIAQAYMQKRVGDTGRPSQSEIEDYFNKHPQFFAKRRQLTMSQLVLPVSNVTPELRTAADRAKSLDEVAAFLDARQVVHGRAQVTRSTADLKPELASKLLSMPKGQLFLVQEGQRAMLVAVDEVREAPVALDIAAPQIAQYLAKRKNTELAQAEIQRLRGSAKIEYMNKDLAPDATAPGALPAAAAAPASLAGLADDGQAGAATDAGGDPAAKAALDRGVAGLE